LKGDLAIVKEASYVVRGKALSTTKEGLDKARSVDIEGMPYTVQMMSYTQLR